MRKILITTLIVLSAIPTLFAEDTKTEFVPLPVIASSPDTGLMFGALGMVLFTPTDRPDAQSDQLMGVGIYTLKNQYSFALKYKKNFQDGIFVNEGEASYSYFPTTYYGIGADTSSSNEETYAANSIAIEQAFYYSFANDFKVGPKYRFEHFKSTETEENGLFERDTPVGGDKSRVSLPSLVFSFDTRDTDIYTTEGSFASLEAGSNAKVVGATENSSFVQADIRSFVNLHERKHILGFQAMATYQGGDVVLPLMEGVGDATILRGFESSRYIDKCKYAAQSEYRFPLPFVDTVSWLAPLSATVFGGFANVAPRMNDFKNDTLRFAYGMGLRYAVMKEEKVNLRLDITMNSDNEPNFYIDFMEAF